MRDVLVVVDYQRDFVDGALGFESAKNLDEKIAMLVDEFAAYDNPVIFTYDTHESDYLAKQEGKRLPVEHCIKGEPGWELYGETKNVHDRYAKIDKVIDVYKPTFGSIQLADVIKDINTKEGINSITIVGIVTNMCVISNAVICKATAPEARIIIRKDLVDSFDKEMHEAALKVMGSMQMDVE